MIFDDIKNWKSYFGASKNFEQLVGILSKLENNTPNGTYGLTNECYYKVMSYNTQDRPKVIEAHQKEIDIQIVLAGQEAIKVYARDQVSIVQQYDAQTDCEFYETAALPQSHILLKPGKMAIFYPQDLHACQFNINNRSELIKKVVFKANEEFFTH